MRPPTIEYEYYMPLLLTKCNRKNNISNLLTFFGLCLSRSGMMIRLKKNLYIFFLSKTPF